ncbi:MAG: type II toxin-antitoxin system YafQ family toxin [Candidatus Zambryskibacteria bacterium]|nr:type II toxin-antitoxin system YafQ family toxin [Candidatus Zambryskibacteria bacterium]
MYTRKPTRSFRKSLRKIASSGSKGALTDIEEVINKLSKGIRLGQKHKDHPLAGELQYYRECHVRPDMLLIYRIEEDNLVLIDVGSHSQLFK